MKLGNRFNLSIALDGEVFNPQRPSLESTALLDMICAVSASEGAA
jgi:hypothetical protein